MMIPHQIHPVSPVLRVLLYLQDQLDLVRISSALQALPIVTLTLPPHVKLAKLIPTQLWQAPFPVFLPLYAVLAHIQQSYRRQQAMFYALLALLSNSSLLLEMASLVHRRHNVVATSIKLFHQQQLQMQFAVIPPLAMGTNIKWSMLR